MKIKISDKLISFPPYISTTWENVRSIRIEPASTAPEFLVLTLSDGYRVKIPDVDPKLSQMIFNAHLRFNEQKELLDNKLSPISGFPIKLGQNFIHGLNGLTGMEEMGNALQHNQANSQMPNLPEEVLNKVKTLTKLLSEDDAAFLPKAEPHCNCMHCQLARAMQPTADEKVQEIEEEITDEDLRFRSWDIAQSGEKLYIVKNPIDHQEQYSVYLGDPIGCTCGQKNCEHIKAVLNS
jgi:hypothetical protein